MTVIVKKLTNKLKRFGFGNEIFKPNGLGKRRKGLYTRNETHNLYIIASLHVLRNETLSY